MPGDTSPVEDLESGGEERQSTSSTSANDLSWSLQLAAGLDSGASLLGEVGILKHAMRYDRMPNGFVLAIEHAREQYLCFLIFDEGSFCMLIYDVLEARIGWSIKELGSLAVTYIL